MHINDGREYNFTEICPMLLRMIERKKKSNKITKKKNLQLNGCKNDIYEYQTLERNEMH